MTGLTRLIVAAMVVCLTIQQSAWAARASRSSSVKTTVTQVIASSDESGFVASDQEEEELINSSSIPRAEESLRSSQKKFRSKKTFGGPTQTIAHVTPGERSLLFGADVRALSYSMEYSYRGVSGRASGSGIATQLDTSYGVSDNFYLGLRGYFTSLKADSGFSGSNLTDKTEGFREPEVMAGFQLASERARFVAELNARVPIGPSTQRSDGLETTYDNLDGGSSVEPSVMGVFDVKPARLFARTAYRFYQERRIESRSISTSQNFTVQGGDTFNLETGLELPRLYNWGLMGSYMRIDISKNRNDRTGETGSSPAAGVFGVMTYAGLPVGRSALLVPKLAYATYLDGQLNGVSVDRSSFWTFGLNGMYMF